MNDEARRWNAKCMHTFVYMLTKRSAVPEFLVDVADGSEKINSARDCFNRAERMTSTSTALQSDNDSIRNTEREREKKDCILFFAFLFNVFIQRR